jgi:hypothetical protein
MATRRPLFLAAPLLVLSSAAAGQERGQADGGPRSIALYNGKNLEGWVQRGEPATMWRAEGDTIVGASDAKARAHGFLATVAEYGDFILDVDFKVDPRFRAGIQIRSMSYPEYYGGVVHGDQVVIAPAATTGGIMEEAGRHWLYDLKGNDAIVKAYRQNDWNHLTVACVGDTIKTWLNGVEGANLRDAKTPVGFIAFEVNRGSANQTLEARFKNIRVLSLDQKAPARRTYVEVPELSPANQKTWIAPVLTQPENKPNPGTATVFKHPPRPPQTVPPTPAKPPEPAQAKPAPAPAPSQPAR